MGKEELIRLLEKDWVSRDILQDILQMSDRKVRLFLSGLNEELSRIGKCVLSSGSRKGYHIPSVDNKEDIEMARLIEKELRSKAISIFERRMAISGFLKLAENDPIQDTLF